MKAITWIIVGVAIIGLGYYAYQKTKKGKNILDKVTKAIKKDTNFSTETCEILKKDDVVAYFKSLSLIKGRHIPFVARANKFSQSPLTIDVPIDVPYGEYNVLLGVYDESSHKLSTLKAIVAQKWDSEFATMIGKEDLIVLS